MMTGWPLVGRERALERVGELLDRDDVSGAVLVGPAGVGKTRLATACIDLGEEAGMSTAVAVASRAAMDIPLGALSGLLPAVPADAPPGLALLQFARQGLADLAEGKRLMLVVDDAHNLDDASALVVHQLISAGDAFVIATVRSGESVPDPVVALWKDGVAERVEVGALPQEAVAQLVEVALGGPVEAVASQALAETSEGNVLYLRELVLAGLETHALVDDAGLWRLVGTIASSPRLTDLVSTRLAGLSEEEVSALELVAFGEPIGVDVIERLSSGSALEQLERKGLLVTHADQRRVQARLAHPLHGDVLRDRTPVLRARAAQRELADAVEHAGARRRDDALRVALWRLDGGGDAEVELMIEGARLAKFAYDYDTAERLARYAFEAAPSFEAGEMLAGCIGERGDVVGTEAILAELGPLAETDEQRARLAGIHASLLFWILARGDEAIAVCEAAMADMTDAEARDDVAGQVAVLEASAGRCAEAVERVAHLLDRNEGRVFCHATMAACLAYSGLGEQDRAIDLAIRGKAAYEAIGTQFTMFEPSLLDVVRGHALLELGRLDEARQLAESGFAQAVVEHDDGGWAFFSICLGAIDLEAGTFASPTRRWREAAARFLAIGRFGHARWALAGLALAYSQLGDVAATKEVLAELEALGDHPAHREEPSVIRAKGWLAVAEHDMVGALAAFSEAADYAAKLGMRVRELTILQDMARLGQASAVLERAQEVASHMDGDLVAARVRHIAALASGKPAELALAGEALEACGSMITAAEAMFSAADAYRSAGDQRQAGGWSRRGSQLAALCEGVKTPGLIRVEGPTPLTKREREIALMAGNGLSSREISEQLFLSIRTVDNHLARVYEKLGISSRAELADALTFVE